MSTVKVQRIGKEVWADLRLAPMFSGLGESDLADLLADATLETHGDGTVMFRHGDVLDQLFIVVDGHVETYVEAPDGRRSIIEIVEKLGLLGDAGILGDSGALVSARVLNTATVVAVPAAPFLAKLSRRFDLILLMLGSMSFRLRLLVRQISELKLKTTAQRLGGFLLTLTDFTAGEVTVRFPYDKRVVAEQLGMKPESLSRALARLAAVGVRSQADNVVIIADVARLRRFSIEEGME